MKPSSRGNLARLPLALALVATAACGDDDAPIDGPGADTGADAIGDASGDATTDVGGDSIGTDATEDTAPDGEPTDTSADTDPGDTSTDTDSADTLEDTAATRYTLTGTAAATDIDGTAWLALTVDGEVVEALEVDADGAFAFTSEWDAGTAFEVAVTDHPLDGFCDVTPTTGVLDDGDAVLGVRCVPGSVLHSEYGYEPDQEFGRSSVRADGDELLTESWEIQGVGADGLPFTADDEEIFRTRERSTLDGQVFWGADYGDFGPDGLPWTDDDFVYEYSVLTFDEHGQITRRDEFDDSGDDGVWFTDDDRIDEDSPRWVRAYDTDDRLTCVMSFDAGPDLTFETDDDVFDSGSSYEHTPHPTLDAVETATYFLTGPGDDGVGCTADDVRGELWRTELISNDGRTVWSASASGYTEQRRDENNNLAHVVTWTWAEDGVIGGPDVDTLESYIVYAAFSVLGRRWQATATAPGPDGVWFTSDDIFTTAAVLSVLDDDGERRLSVTYRTTTDTSLNGPDGEWGTADDLARFWLIRGPGADGMRCDVRHTDAGADGMWDETSCGNGATDDTLEYVDWESVDAMGRVDRWCRSIDAGPDAVWATDDDTVDARPTSEFCGTRTYVTDARFVSNTITSEGPDGEPFTDDDSYGFLRLLEYDDGGRLVFESEPNGPGDDGVWNTADDDLEYYSTQTFDRSGNPTAQTEYSGPGPDGQWYTDDDVVEEYAWYEMTEFGRLLRSR